MPQMLGASNEQRIQKKYAAMMQVLAVQEQGSRQEAQTEADGIRNASQQEQLQLVAKGNAVRVNALQRREALDQSLSLARKSLEDERWKEAQATRELEALSNITFIRFLAHAARGR